MQNLRCNPIFELNVDLSLSLSLYESAPPRFVLEGEGIIREARDENLIGDTQQAGWLLREPACLRSGLAQEIQSGIT